MAHPPSMPVPNPPHDTPIVLPLHEPLTLIVVPFLLFPVHVFVHSGRWGGFVDALVRPEKFLGGGQQAVCRFVWFG